LFKRDTPSAVFTRVTIGSARVNSNVTVGTGVSVFTETSVVSDSRLSFTHSLLGTSIILAIGLLLLTIDAGISHGANTSITLRFIDTRSSVITRVRLTLVDIGLALLSSKASRTYASGSMILSNTQASVATIAIRALNSFAFVSRLSSDFRG